MVQNPKIEYHEEEFTTEGEIHGYHVYQMIWTPVVDEVLECVREEHNDEDRYAVAVKKNRTTVGHCPKEYLPYVPRS